MGRVAKLNTFCGVTTAGGEGSETEEARSLLAGFAPPREATSWTRVLESEPRRLSSPGCSSISDCPLISGRTLVSERVRASGRWLAVCGLGLTVTCSTAGFVGDMRRVLISCSSRGEIGRGRLLPQYEVLLGIPELPVFRFCSPEGTTERVDGGEVAWEVGGSGAVVNDFWWCVGWTTVVLDRGAEVGEHGVRVDVGLVTGSGRLCFGVFGTDEMSSSLLKIAIGGDGGWFWFSSLITVTAPAEYLRKRRRLRCLPSPVAPL